MRQHGVILLALLCGLIMAGGAFAGSVTGTINYDDRMPPPGKGPFAPVKMDADPGCASKYSGGSAPPSGQLVLGDANGLANVMVQLKGASGGAGSGEVVIDQNGCMYNPRVAFVQVGQSLKFKNSDDLLHNVHGLPKVNREFNIGMPGVLKEKDVSLGKPEPVFNVKCDVHPWMKAYVAVIDHPYHAVSGADGKFTIDNVPDGTYDVEAWHERLGTQTGKATVSGGAATVDFTFKIPK